MSGKNCYLSLLTILSLICSTGYATAPAIEISFINNKQNIAHILKLQHKITMSKKPKELSQHPQATCFEADIDQFIPKGTANVKPIYGCIFSDQIAMNAALLRAGLYVHTDAGMATDAQLYNSKLMSTVGGHDFNGRELTDFCKNPVIPTETAVEHQTFKAIEAEFAQQVIQPIIAKHSDNFIFFAIINTKKFKANLSHELLHAQYYNVPQIASILETVWQKVSQKNQTLIVDCLRAGGYDMQQHELLLREFYSYFLQYNATQYLAGIKVLEPMSPLAAIYAPKIRAALAKDHIKVLTVTK